jgi:hypothetical protein
LEVLVQIFQECLKIPFGLVPIANRNCYVLCEQAERHRIELGGAFPPVGQRPSRTLGVPAVRFDFSGSHGFGALHDALQSPLQPIVSPDCFISARSTLDGWISTEVFGNKPHDLVVSAESAAWNVASTQIVHCDHFS